MNQQKRENEALYRYRIIAPLLNEHFKWGTLGKKIRELANKTYRHHDRGYEKFAYKTIQEWYYNYKRYGFSGLETKPRSDKGTSRHISKELGEFIITMKKKNPRQSIPQIMRELIKTGKIYDGEISRNSVYRLLHNHQLELRRYHSPDEKMKRRYSFEFSNDCWQGDVKHAGYFKLRGFNKKKKLFLFVFIDDASRIVPHGGFCFQENLENFLLFLRQAFLKKGLPERLYLDNASYFKSPRVKQIGARLGVKIIYCTPYSPYQKGKVERFIRTCSEQFLSTLNRDKEHTPEELNQLFISWIEKDYHQTLHSSLNQTPLSAWQNKARKIRYPDVVNLDREFCAEEKRKIKKDGSFSLKSIIYEIDSFYSGESVRVRYYPHKMNKVWVYLSDGTVLEAEPLDEIVNSSIPRLPGGRQPKKNIDGIRYSNSLKPKEGKNV